MDVGRRRTPPVAGNRGPSRSMRAFCSRCNSRSFTLLLEQRMSGRIAGGKICQIKGRACTMSKVKELEWLIRRSHKGGTSLKISHSVNQHYNHRHHQLRKTPNSISHHQGHPGPPKIRHNTQSTDHTPILGTMYPF